MSVRAAHIFLTLSSSIMAHQIVTKTHMIGTDRIVQSIPLTTSLDTSRTTALPFLEIGEPLQPATISRVGERFIENPLDSSGDREWFTAGHRRNHQRWKIG